MLTTEEEQDYKLFLEDCSIIEERFKSILDEVKSDAAKQMIEGINEEFFPTLKQAKAQIMIELGMI